MDVFGLTGIQAIIVIAVSGVLLQNGIGWLKGGTAFDIRQSAASGIIAFFAALMIVGPQIEALPNDLLDEAKFMFFIGLVAQIAGFDMLAKNSVKAVVGRIKSRKE